MNSNNPITQHHYKPSADGKSSKSGLAGDHYERQQVVATHRRLMGTKHHAQTRSVSDFLKKRG
jgi:hypothetical protein